MKKLGLLALAALLVVAFTVPAAAIESEFGGYWRTRFYTNQNFTGEDQTEADDFMWVDTRTRLYYTAIFHENLKFVNKFEWDAIWGTDPLGDIGADGQILEIKNSYADFNLGPMNFKVGIQGGRIARGFIMDDDFSGIQAAFKGDTFSIGGIWVKAWEGGMGKDANDFDVDYYGIIPSFNVGGMMKISPYFIYAMSDDAQNWTGARPTGVLSGTEELNLWYLGADIDVDLDAFSLWFTGIYQGGDMDFVGGGSQDFAAYLAAIGGGANLGMFDVHGQFVYASGDDDAADDDWEQFWVPRGQSYYWSEIMGYGIFDWQVSNNSPADQVGNVMFGNIGASVKPMDKLKVAFDVWAAWKAEDVVTVKGNEESFLGTEVDLVITYQLVENLNLDLVGAYLFAGDATTLEADDDANPYEVGTRLSLSF